MGFNTHRINKVHVESIAELLNPGSDFVEHDRFLTSICGGGQSSVNFQIANITLAQTLKFRLEDSNLEAEFINENKNPAISLLHSVLRKPSIGKQSFSLVFCIPYSI